jgi:glyoxylase-like metal-dependent hydrolase (beta-lactamase superfamily II)
MTSTSSLPWVDPGAFEVASGVFRVPLPLPNDGLKAVNVYVLVTEVGLVCIDAGWAIPESKRLFVDALSSLGFGLQDVTRFLVTHVHRDHYTQAVDIRRETGARVGLGAGERPTLSLLQDTTRSPLGGQLAQLREIGAGTIADTVLHQASPRPVGLGVPGRLDDRRACAPVRPDARGCRDAGPHRRAPGVP